MKVIDNDKGPEAVEAHSCVVICEISLNEQDATVINQMQDVLTRRSLRLLRCLYRAN